MANAGAFRQFFFLYIMKCLPCSYKDDVYEPFRTFVYVCVCVFPYDGGISHDNLELFSPPQLPKYFQDQYRRNVNVRKVALLFFISFFFSPSSLFGPRHVCTQCYRFARGKNYLARGALRFAHIYRRNSTIVFLNSIK